MGGSIAVGFRFTDNSIFVQDRWTNSMPYWFKDARMLNGDREHIDKYLRMAEEYPVQVPLAPLGYGLVFIDYKTNHFLSMQGYTSFDREHPVYMSTLKNDGPEDFAAERVRYQGLLDDRRLSMQFYHMEKRKIVIESEKLLTGNFLDLFEANHELWDTVEYRTPKLKGNRRLFDYQIDLRPFTYIEFDENAEGAQQMLAKLRELDIFLTEEAIAEWESAIKERARDEDDTDRT